MANTDVVEGVIPSVDEGEGKFFASFYMDEP